MTMKRLRRCWLLCPLKCRAWARSRDAAGIVLIRAIQSVSGLGFVVEWDCDVVFWEG